ncbi:PIN domain-containing protein [Singulisphaera sp. GP187]|uniref:PIN domain-containing protein n=1 Tax=Singulisphaera sp. GP187 TaxID=1882752 RepID=UPI003965642A
MRLQGLVVIPLSPDISLEATNLPDRYNETNKDPMDQIIIATSRVENLPLMTVDEKITPYRHVKLWTPSA